MEDTISKKQLRKFGLLIGLGFPFLIGFLIPVLSGHLFRVWTLWVGIPLFTLGLILPRLLFYPYKSWVVLGQTLGWVNGKIIFGLIFIFLLQPIAFIMRLAGYDPLRRRRKDKKTYREKRELQQTDLTRIF